MAPDVAGDFVFWCSYTPVSDEVKPLFENRYGVEGLLERYQVEKELERIAPGSTTPYDLAFGENTVYLSLCETASFGGGPDVTLDLVIKTLFADDKMARLEMFVDGRPIDEAYPGEPG